MTKKEQFKKDMLAVVKQVSLEVKAEFDLSANEYGGNFIEFICEPKNMAKSTRTRRVNYARYVRVGTYSKGAPNMEAYKITLINSKGRTLLEVYPLHKKESVVKTIEDGLRRNAAILQRDAKGGKPIEYDTM